MKNFIVIVLLGLVGFSLTGYTHLCNDIIEPAVHCHLDGTTHSHSLPDQEHDSPCTPFCSVHAQAIYLPSKVEIISKFFSDLKFENIAVQFIFGYAYLSPCYIWNPPKVMA